MTDPNTPPPAYQPQPSGYQPPAYPSSNQPSTQPPAWTQPSSYNAPSYPPTSPSSGGAAAGPVPGRTLGIVALIGSIVLSFFSVVWLILGIVALVKSRRAGAKNGFAIAAIIISVVAFIVWVIVAVVTIIGIVTVAQLCAQYGSGVYEVNGNPVTLQCG